ncbi:uncharacterized protein EV422DRAFT_428928 [Fimicolochytrium jonesii]|uniref:uncharacterized protein n=1 Tax=Fimicolochytrium jonesii TaxID=1396493 RepID=UPI0022FDC9F9|nr:uncharacterized protein EV422DRAFT_428928 [Fimicolochytrium jonesii]KAI8821709.1 hypothetical protein EV422DRAFT_428928 [Fimicolochytrium jonesii]
MWTVGLWLGLASLAIPNKIYAFGPRPPCPNSATTFRKAFGSHAIIFHHDAQVMERSLVLLFSLVLPPTGRSPSSEKSESPAQRQYP